MYTQYDISFEGETITSFVSATKDTHFQVNSFSTFSVINDRQRTIWIFIPSVGSCVVVKITVEKGTGSLQYIARTVATNKPSKSNTLIQKFGAREAVNLTTITNVERNSDEFVLPIDIPQLQGILHVKRML